jgi:hypothetical protein
MGVAKREKVNSPILKSEFLGQRSQEIHMPIHQWPGYTEEAAGSVGEPAKRTLGGWLMGIRRGSD